MPSQTPSEILGKVVLHAPALQQGRQCPGCDEPVPGTLVTEAELAPEREPLAFE